MGIPLLTSSVKLPQGLLGFESDNNWELSSSEVEPFFALKSCDTKGLEFLLIDPFVVCRDYEIDVDDKSLFSIGIKAPSDIVVLTIITLSSDSSAVTANLAGPLVLNKRTGVGMQVVTQDKRWNTKYDIMKALKNGVSVC